MGWGGRGDSDERKTEDRGYCILTWWQQHDGWVQGELGFGEFQQGHGTAHLERQRDQFRLDRVLRVERVGREQRVCVVHAVAVRVVVPGHPQHGQLEATCKNDGNGPGQ